MAGRTELKYVFWNTGSPDLGRLRYRLFDPTAVFFYRQLCPFMAHSRSIKGHAVYGAYGIAVQILVVCGYFHCWLGILLCLPWHRLYRLKLQSCPSDKEHHETKTPMIQLVKQAMGSIPRCCMAKWIPTIPTFAPTKSPSYCRYPLVIQHSCGKSRFSMEKSTINGHVQHLFWHNQRAG